MPVLVGMVMSKFVGIDPGLDGAIAMIGDGRPEIYDMPVVTKLRRRKGKKVKVRQVDEGELVSIMETLPSVCRVIIEDVHAMSGQGVTSSFSFGRSFGIVLGVVAALGFAYVLTSPQRWKRELALIGRDKNASIMKAKRLFPTAAKYMTKASHHGRADALLLAEYGRRITNDSGRVRQK
jgi:crossover junction endodeoxyribonuclease RuvC